MKKWFHSFIDYGWIRFTILVCKIGYAICSMLCAFYPQYLWYFLIGVVVLLLIEYFCDRKQTKEFKGFEKIKEENKELKAKIYSLSQLKDVLFQHFSTIIYDQIDKERKEDLRVTMYCYDSKNDNFVLLSRYSSKDLYNDRHSAERYPNKGWLYIIWNEQSYKFISNAKCDMEWIDDCMKDVKRYCKVSSCEYKNKKKKKCYNKKLDTCRCLEKQILERKKMKARSVYGTILANNTTRLGIILVEGMKQWDASFFAKISSCLASMKSSPAEILSQFSEEIIKDNSFDQDIAAKIPMEEQNG